MPKFNGLGDIAKYVGGKALDGLGAAGAGGLSKFGYNLASQYGWVQTVSYSGAAVQTAGVAGKTAFGGLAPEINFLATKTPLNAILASGASFIDDGARGGFRYMTQGELTAIQKTGLLRGGRAGDTFFTKYLYKSVAKASQRLGLESTPTLRVEFEILNNPTLLKNGTKVLSLKGLSGGGAEFMTLEPVKVRLINWQLLK